MTTLFPLLLAVGGGLALAPVLLHLLNLHRQQPVRWAAMQFLLESQAKNKAWINLKQWLLLAARVLAILLAGLMAARPQLTGGLASWLPGEMVHHVIVLDDSYSMTDRGSDRTPWEQAIAAIDALASDAAENSRQRITVLLTSQPTEPRPFAADELTTLRNQLAGWRASQSAGGLEQTLRQAAAVAGSTPAHERVMAYVLSDFRQRDLRPADTFATAAEQLERQSQSLALATCVAKQTGNLTIEKLQLMPSAMVAGVEMAASLTITNNGPKSSGKTAVRLWRDEGPLPAIEFGSIPAGESVTRRLPLRYTDPGAHRLLAQLPDDAILADNDCYLALDLPKQREVLVVDGSEGHEGQAFATALWPRGGVSTGWQPQRITPAAFSSVGDLSRFSAVLMLDVDRLSREQCGTLKRYAQHGGGVILVLGEHVDRRFYNQQLLAESDGPLLPIRLDVPTQTALDSSGRQAKLAVVDHPALRIFAGDRASFLDLVRIQQRHALVTGEGQSAPPEVRVLASLSTGAPMLLESIDSPGRVLCLMSTVARRLTATEGWSNLSVSPLFPILANELTAYVAEPQLRPPSHEVGESWSHLTTSHLPDANRLQRFNHDENQFAVVETGGDAAEWGPILQAGVYRLESNSAANKSLAVNIDPREGKLAFANASTLRRQFRQLDLQVLAADQLAGKTTQTSVALYQRVGMVLLLLLAIEQALAYWSSHHRATASGGGGR